VRTRRWETSTSDCRCTGRILWIAAQLAAGHKEHQAKVDMKNISDLQRSGRPQSARTDANVERLNNIIVADRRVTVKQLSLRLDIAEASVCRILEQLGFSKVCARWVPRQLTDARKEIRKTICADLLTRHEDDGDEFFRAS
jgi:histone-lysine N-methyltransferase SETMAR